MSRVHKAFLIPDSWLHRTVKVRIDGEDTTQGELVRFRRRGDWLEDVQVGDQHFDSLPHETWIEVLP